MRPNWVILIYVATLALGLVVAGVLASVTAAVRLGSWILDRPAVGIDGWLAPIAMLTLGVLPWPGLIALAWSVLRPRKPDEHRVDTRPVGTAVVVLTALNEEQAIERVVRDFAAAPGVGSVVVVDNGSHDRTRELAGRAGAHVVSEGRRGYGYACMRALHEGLLRGYATVILCEADNTFRADDIDKLVAYLKHSDLVIGSRTHQALLSSDSQLDSFLTLGNVFVAKLLQLRYWDWTVGGRVRLTDVGCTYLAIRADALGRILSSLKVGGHYFIPHLLIVALEHGLRVVQVPVTFWKRVGSSKGGNASWLTGLVVGLRMVWHILTYRASLQGQVDERGAEAIVRAPSR